MYAMGAGLRIQKSKIATYGVLATTGPSGRRGALHDPGLDGRRERLQAGPMCSRIGDSLNVSR